jgi:hypothetical protein
MMKGRRSFELRDPVQHQAAYIGLKQIAAYIEKPIEITDYWPTYYITCLRHELMFGEALEVQPALLEGAEAFAGRLLQLPEQELARRKAGNLGLQLCVYHLYCGTLAQAHAWAERLYQEKTYLHNKSYVHNILLLLRVILAVELGDWEAVESRMRSWQEFRRQHPEHRHSLEAAVRRMVRQLQRRLPGEPEAAILKAWLPYAETVAARQENECIRPFFDFPRWLQQRLARL